MTKSWVWGGLLTAMALVLPAATSAQQPRLQLAQRGTTLQPDLDVEELTPGQIQRAQEPEAPGRPKGAAPKAATPAPKREAVHSSSPPRKEAPQTHTIACSGVFAKTSSHIKLAMAFNAQNISFAEVDGPEGTRVMASVLYPQNPKGRLEVWWSNDADRSQTSLIVINGQSVWTAPRGLRLGMTLAQVERLNGKPFKLKGFDAEGSSQISDWQGGALEKVAGGCNVGARMVADPKTPADARSALAADKEFASNLPAVKAAQPKIAEILIGYLR